MNIVGLDALVIAAGIVAGCGTRTADDIAGRDNDDLDADNAVGVLTVDNIAAAAAAASVDDMRS